VKRKFLFAVCCFVTLSVSAQVAAELEILLNTSEVSYQQAAWLVLGAADIFEPTGIPDQDVAFDHAMNLGWLPSNAAPTDRARLDAVSLLIMRAFDIRGGVFFTLTGRPRYAYRELVFRNIIQGRSNPAMAVSGESLLFIVNRVFSFQEANQL